MLSQKNQALDTWMLLQISQARPIFEYVDIHGFRPDSVTPIYGLGPKTLKAWTLDDNPRFLTHSVDRAIMDVLWFMKLYMG